MPSKSYFSKSIVEYIFLDLNRIDSYAEQIGSSFAYDKVPQWGSELSITGPKVQTLQGRHKRALHTHEKIENIIKYLDKHKLLYNKRPTLKRGSIYNDFDRKDKLFVLESFLASKVTIPHKTNGMHFSDINMWFSLEIGDEKNMLCLLEDYRKTDAELRIGNRFLSAYTLLTSIINAINDDLAHTIIGDYIPSRKMTSNWMEELHDDWQRSRKYVYEFIQDPIALFKHMGCIVSQPRKIISLYRIRDIGRDSEGMCTSVFGYPIFIADNSLNLNPGVIHEF